MFRYVFYYVSDFCGLRPKDIITHVFVDGCEIHVKKTSVIMK